jgi:hypothetical protein
MTKTRPQSLYGCFLQGVVPRESRCKVVSPLTIGPLTRAQDALNEPLTLTVKNRPDPVNINNVVTNADEHGSRVLFYPLIAQALTRALRLEDVTL